MARPLRIEFEGALYHVMARGNARSDIFVDDDDRQLFVDNLGRVSGRFDWRVWAWCLMSNHYHLLVETLEPTLSRGMREVKGLGGCPGSGWPDYSSARSEVKTPFGW